MTVKLVAFLRKQSDLDRQEFIAWYEANHVPTIHEVTPRLVDYRRDFLRETIGGVDVIAELTYASWEAFGRAPRSRNGSPQTKTIRSNPTASTSLWSTSAPGNARPIGVSFLVRTCVGSVEKSIEG